MRELQEVLKNQFDYKDYESDAKFDRRVPDSDQIFVRFSKKAFSNKINNKFEFFVKKYLEIVFEV